MKIAIIGVGNVGLTLGKKWIQAKHEVVFGSRPESVDKHRKKIATEDLQAKVESVETAARDAEIVVLAVPHEEALNAADSLREFKDKTIIDVSNWFKPDFSGLELGFSTSGAEEIQKRLPGSHVVKAFNHYGAAVMRNPQFGDRKAVLYFCGSNPESLKKVSQLVSDVGFEGVAIDHLEFARALEPLSLVWAAGIKRFGAEHAFALLKR